MQEAEQKIRERKRREERAVARCVGEVNFQKIVEGNVGAWGG
jgi:hypothetical protein